MSVSSVCEQRIKLAMRALDVSTPAAFIKIMFDLGCLIESNPIMDEMLELKISPDDRFVEEVKSLLDHAGHDGIEAIRIGRYVFDNSHHSHEEDDAYKTALKGYKYFEAITNEAVYLTKEYFSVNLSKPVVDIPDRLIADMTPESRESAYGIARRVMLAPIMIELSCERELKKIEQYLSRLEVLASQLKVEASEDRDSSYTEAADAGDEKVNAISRYCEHMRVEINTVRSNGYDTKHIDMLVRREKRWSGELDKKLKVIRYSSLGKSIARILHAIKTGIATLFGVRATQESVVQNRTGNTASQQFDAPPEGNTASFKAVKKLDAAARYSSGLENLGLFSAGVSADRARYAKMHGAESVVLRGRDQSACKSKHTEPAVERYVGPTRPIPIPSPRMRAR